MSFEEPPYPVQDSRIHRGCDAAGLCVLLARVIDTEQSLQAWNNLSFRAMCELEERARCDYATPFQNFEVPIPGDLPERQDRFWFQDFNLALEVTAAVRDFFWERLIVRRCAPARRANVYVLQPQPIVAAQGSGLIRESSFVQRGIQKVT